MTNWRKSAATCPSPRAASVGEGLADPQLVLTWLLGAIGTPIWVLGLLVPVRESLAMLPQLAISARLRRLSIRKTVYVFGCVVQGAAIISFGLMGWFAQMFSGALAGILAVALIAIFALGRSLCSISHKDLLGKTVDRGRRGSVLSTTLTTRVDYAAVSRVVRKRGRC